MKYSFDWSRPDKQLNLPIDLLNRAKYAEALSAHVVESSNDINDYVLNLNAAWGSGKTYFIRRWHSELSRYHATVYIDAWKHDFSNDPLLTVISELKKQLNEKFGLDVGTEMFNRIGAIAKAGAPILLKGLAKKFIGLNVDEASEEIEANTAGDLASSITSAMINSHEEQVDAINDFKKQLKVIAKLVGEMKDVELPIVVFIDELDRCKPTFAIELLEAVKHLFDVEEFTFVISTDTEQLAHSVSAIYGQGFDSKRYLSRFFTDSVALPEKPMIAFLSNDQHFNQIFSEGFDELYVPPFIFNQSLIEAFADVLNELNISVRSVKRMLKRLAFFMRQLSAQNLMVDPLFFLLCLVLREADEQAYKLFFEAENVAHNKTVEKLRSKTKLYNIDFEVGPDLVKNYVGLGSTFEGRINLDSVFFLRFNQIIGKVDCDVIGAKVIHHPTGKVIPDQVIRLSNLATPKGIVPLRKKDYLDLIERSFLLD